MLKHKKAVNQHLLPFFIRSNITVYIFFTLSYTRKKRRKHELFTIHGYCQCCYVGNNP